MPGAPAKGGPRAPGPSPSRFRRWRSRRVVVQDDSMRPALWPGDRLLVDTGAYRTRLPRVGEIVVVVDPEAPARWLVKRVGAVTGETVVVLGDQATGSRDSRRFGPVPLTSVVGQVYRRYFPRERRTDL